MPRLDRNNAHSPPTSNPRDVCFPRFLLNLIAENPRLQPPPPYIPLGRRLRTTDPLTPASIMGSPHEHTFPFLSVATRTI
jgi:hypothetical protein